MIYFNFRLYNPLNHCFDEIFEKDKLISKYKAIRIALSKSNELFTFVFKLNFKEDHAGCFIELGLLYFLVTFQFYDIRHWDIDNNCWDNY